jgi:hypothetical protein
VLLFAFQAEAEGLLVEMAKFPGGAHPFGKSFGQGGALSASSDQMGGIPIPSGPVSPGHWPGGKSHPTSSKEAAIGCMVSGHIPLGESPSGTGGSPVLPTDDGHG